MLRVELLFQDHQFQFLGGHIPARKSMKHSTEFISSLKARDEHKHQFNMPTGAFGHTLQAEDSHKVFISTNLFFVRKKMQQAQKPTNRLNSPSNLFHQKKFSHSPSHSIVRQLKAQKKLGEWCKFMFQLVCTIQDINNRRVLSLLLFNKTPASANIKLSASDMCRHAIFMHNKMHLKAARASSSLLLNYILTQCRLSGMKRFQDDL